MAVRTVFRQPNPVSHILFFAAVVLGLSNSACAPTSEDKIADTWSLTPPALVAANEVTYLERLDVKKIDQAKGMKGLTKLAGLPLDSHLVFARADLGLEFQYRSECESEHQSGKGKTTDSILLASLLPPPSVHRALTEEAQATTEKQDAPKTCSIEIVVFSPTGSSHGFKLKDFVFLPSAAERAKPAANPSLTANARLKILCGSWWAQEDLVSTKLAHGYQRRLEALALGSVNGVDQRAQIWNPACATFQVDREDQETYLGISYPLQHSRQIEVQESFLLNHSQLGISTKQSLGIWKLINRSKYPQVLRFEAPPSKIRLTLVNSSEPFAQWARPVVLDIQVSITTPETVRMKSHGGTTYVHLDPEQVATLEVKILTLAFCHPGKLAPGLPVMRLETDRPIYFDQTSATMDLDTFSGTAGATLAKLSPVSQKALFHRADLVLSENDARLIRTSRPTQESFAHSSSAKASCIGGDYFGPHSYALPE
jgi:hypothetical protein